MPPVGFEPPISAGERPQTYALHRAATETGIYAVLAFDIWVKFAIEISRAIFFFLTRLKNVNFCWSGRVRYNWMRFLNLSNILLVYTWWFFLPYCTEQCTQNPINWRLSSLDSHCNLFSMLQIILITSSSRSTNSRLTDHSTIPRTYAVCISSSPASRTAFTFDVNI